MEKYTVLTIVAVTTTTTCIIGLGITSWITFVTIG